MSGRWSRARMVDVRSDRGPEYWRPWARTEGYGAGWHSIRSHFGIQGFGVNACEAGAGEELIVPHEETEYGGQEELYYLVRGRARFTLDGDQVELAPDELLHVAPEVQREAVALEPGTLVLAIGGIPGQAYRAWD